MRKNAAPCPMLVALKDGIRPLAAPMLCGDLVGPQSFFGESAPIPRPLRNVAKSDFTTDDGELLELMQANAVVLWEQGKTVASRATDAMCAVPVATFLAGACDSTFTIAWALANAGMFAPFSGVLSILQERARGQMRKEWISPRGNLSVSFLLPPSPVFSGEGASVIVGMLVISALKECGYELLLKWPNDLITPSHKKCGGILLEERGGMLMAGLGINLEEAPKISGSDLEGGALPSTVLSAAAVEEEEEVCPPFPLWQRLVDKIIEEYTQSVDGKSSAEVMPLAETFLAWKGRKIVVMDEGRSVRSGLCRGLGSRGGLIIAGEDGATEEITSGSIRLA